MATGWREIPGFLLLVNVQLARAGAKSRLRSHPRPPSLTPPVTEAQGTSTPSASVVALRKGTPRPAIHTCTHTPGSRFGDSLNIRTHPRAGVFLQILSTVCSHTRPPSAPHPGLRSRQPAEWGRGAHVPAPPPPKQGRGERSALAAGPIPLPPTLTLSLDSDRNAGQAGLRETERAR